MEFKDLCEILKIKNLSNIKEVKKRYKDFAKKYHPDVCQDWKKIQEFTKVTTLYNEYLSLYKNINFNEEKEIKTRYDEKVFCNKNNNFIKKELDIIIPIEELIFKKNFKFYFNEKEIQIKNEEINDQNGQIIKNNFIINYNIRMKKDIYTDNFKRIIKEIFIPFPFFILGGKININIWKYKFSIEIEKNHEIGEILEIKSSELSRPFFIKLLPSFPNYEKLTSKQKKELLTFI